MHNERGSQPKVEGPRVEWLVRPEYETRVSKLAKLAH